MEDSEAENVERHPHAEAVGEMLAEAFVARVKRFPPASRDRLLIACRARLLQDHAVAKLFEDE